MILPQSHINRRYRPIVDRFFAMKGMSEYNYRMIMKPLGSPAVLILFLSFLAACGGPSANSNSRAPSNRISRTDEANSTKTNVEELGMLVRIPYETEDIVWKSYPSAKRIIAVLRFSPVNADKIVSEAGGTPEGRSLQVETWFPDELIAQGEMSGDDALKGISYPATAFYQEPYTTGKITRVEGSDYFVLDLVAK